MTQLEIAAMIMQGLCSNPNVFAHNSQYGWGLVNCSDGELAHYCATLAKELIEEVGNVQN